MFKELNFALVEITRRKVFTVLVKMWRLISTRINRLEVKETTVESIY